MKLGRDQRGVRAARTGHRLGVGALGQHRLGAAEQGSHQHLEARYVGGGQAAQPALAGPGAQPVEGSPCRVPQRGRAQLHPLGRAGGSGGANDDRRTSATPSSSAERTVVTPSASSIEPGPRAAISSAAPGRQPGVERQDRRSGAVERRRKQLDQPRGRPLDQDRAQGTHCHDR